MSDEARMLAARSHAEREMYLYEVAHCAHRGPDEAEALRRAVAEIKAAAGKSWRGEGGREAPAL